MRGTAVLAAILSLGAQGLREERGKFKLTYFGKDAGVEEYRLEEFENGEVVLFSKARFEVEVGGKKQPFAFDTVLTMDKALAPQRYAGYHRSGAEERQAKIEWRKGFALPDKKPQVRTAALHLLDNNVHAHYLPLLRRFEGGTRKFKIFNPGLLADVEAAVEEKGEKALRRGDREVRVREIQVNIGALAATVHVDAGRRPLRISIPPVGALAELEGFEGWELGAPVAEAARPETIEESEVTFKNGDVTLAGSVTRPKGAGPWPAVVLVSDADAEDRNGNKAPGRDDAPGAVEGPDCSFLRTLAFAISEAGAVVLRADDRGCGGSGGDLFGARPSELAGDVEAAVALLRARPDVSSVSLVGHGEGGVIAARVAAKDPKIRSVLLLSTPARPFEEVMLSGLERTLRAQGTGEGPLKDILAKQRRLFADIRKAKGDTMVIDERKTAIAGVRERLSHDLEADLRQIKGSVGAFYGGTDVRATPADADRIRQTRPEAAVRTFEGLDHQFLGKDRRVDPGFLKALQERLRQGP